MKCSQPIQQCQTGVETMSLTAAARRNGDFLHTVWTGTDLQVTVMCIPVCGQIPAEQHAQSDQMLRVEAGQALICAGSAPEDLSAQRCLCSGDVVFIPRGTLHRVVNIGQCPLRLSLVYAPPVHEAGTVYPTVQQAR